MSGGGSARGGHFGVLQVTELVSGAGCLGLDVVHDGPYNHGLSECFAYSRVPYLYLVPLVKMSFASWIQSACVTFTREDVGFRTTWFTVVQTTPVSTSICSSSLQYRRTYLTVPVGVGIANVTGAGHDVGERRFRRKTREAAQLEGGEIRIRKSSRTTSEYRVESVRRE